MATEGTIMPELETEVDPALVAWLARNLRANVPTEEINSKASQRFENMTGAVLNETWNLAQRQVSPTQTR